jgi:hypothetical protein
MEPEVVPQPEPDELAAIREALAAADEAPSESPWWRAGLELEEPA